jgi:hypothetical protein
MMDKDQDKGMNRREFIRKAAITGAVAWAVPAIQTVAATPAYANHSGTPQDCQHSLGGDSGGGCMTACQSSGQGCGAACNQFCGPTCDCPGNFCPCDEVCDPAFWSNCTYTGPACTGACP